MLGSLACTVITYLKYDQYIHTSKNDGCNGNLQTVTLSRKTGITQPPTNVYNSVPLSIIIPSATHADITGSHDAIKLDKPFSSTTVSLI